MNDNVFSIFGIKPDNPIWHDWQWQCKNRITGIDELARVVSLSEKDKQDISICLNRFRMAITPYYASLMDPDNPMCPIRMQAIPTIFETCKLPWELEDPLNEEFDSPVKYIVHRYPDRVLMVLTDICPMFCRHCTRKREWQHGWWVRTDDQIEPMLDYIRNNKKVRYVILLGECCLPHASRPPSPSANRVI